MPHPLRLALLLLLLLPGAALAQGQPFHVVNRTGVPAKELNAVRTPREVDAVVRSDLKAQLGLLDLRHVAGDAGLSARTRATVLDRWAAGCAAR